MAEIKALLAKWLEDDDLAELLANEWQAHFQAQELDAAQWFTAFQGEIRHRIARGIENLRAPRVKA